VEQEAPVPVLPRVLQEPRGDDLIGVDVDLVVGRGDGVETRERFRLRPPPASVARP
jgi:hypothetical protein